MFDVFKQKPSIVREAQKAKFLPIFIVQLLIFVVFSVVSQVVTMIPVSVVMMIRAAVLMARTGINPQDPTTFTQEHMNELQDGMMMILLFCTAVVIGLSMIYCRFIERRSLYSMGFGRSKALKDYMLGLLIGFGMFSASVLIAALTGTLKYQGVILGNGLGILVLFFLGFVIQGMSEEVMLRGYFMVSVAAKKSILLAVLSNSILFALLHIFNHGISILPLINLALFGIFASIYMLKADNIWGIAAVHTIWNFVQGNVYGIRVSGMELTASVFSFAPTETGTLINGGSFGLEGGLAVTAVLLIGTIVAMRVKGRNVEPEAEVQTEVQTEAEAEVVTE